MHLPYVDGVKVPLSTQGSDLFNAPDYNQATIKKNIASFTAPANGWAMVFRYAIDSDAPSWICVNKKPVMIHDYDGDDGRYSSVFVPISKGDTITVGRSPNMPDPQFDVMYEENILLLYFYPAKIY